MSDLFSGSSVKPLAERMRPQSLNEVLGQDHLLGKRGVLRQLVAQAKKPGFRIPSVIFWGPPGSGKTTLARIMAKESGYTFTQLNAIDSGVKELRTVIQRARNSANVLLFIDEIHRFNKGQQDALLHAVEEGIVSLVGATTENPSFEVNSALLSRCQVYRLNSLTEEQLEKLLQTALANDSWLKTKSIRISEKQALFNLSGGDGRKMLNNLELVVQSVNTSPVEITDQLVQEAVQQKTINYDKKGEEHYDLASALIKSIRASDPNAGVYYLARMIEGGEDLSFIARRLLILSSEDIGNANPNALVLANNTFQAVQVIGYPEVEIILSQCVVYLACSPKSNASYKAIKEAGSEVKKSGSLPTPLALRNAVTSLMKKDGYSSGYRYAHDYPGNFAEMECLPAELKGRKFYDPGNNPKENDFRKRLKNWWKGKYKY
jgi:putative ATPase